jgi:hypothetical protein
MKKHLRNTKLRVSTETLRRLSGSELAGVAGGGSVNDACPLSCACPTMNADCGGGGGTTTRPSDDDHEEEP